MIDVRLHISVQVIETGATIRMTRLDRVGTFVDGDYKNLVFLRRTIHSDEEHEASLYRAVSAEVSRMMYAMMRGREDEPGAEVHGVGGAPTQS